MRPNVYSAIICGTKVRSRRPASYLSRRSIATSCSWRNGGTNREEKRVVFEPGLPRGKTSTIEDAGFEFVLAVDFQHVNETNCLAMRLSQPRWSCDHSFDSVPRVAATRGNPGLFSVTASR